MKQMERVFAAYIILEKRTSVFMYAVFSMLPIRSGVCVPLCPRPAVERSEFIKKFCRWVVQGDGYEYLCLQERANYDCILWNNGCIAYNYRPFQCSSYPFWDYLLEHEQHWSANAKSCPGINHGQWHSAEEIQGLLDTAKQFPVIRRNTSGEDMVFTKK